MAGSRAFGRDAALAPKDGKSIVSGPDFPPLARQTIPQFFREAVSKFGDRDAMVFSSQDIRLSYREFSSAVDETAAGLLSLGLKRGDRVGIWSPNRIEWTLTQFATARIGLVLVNVNPAYRTSELEFALNKVGCRALIAAKSFKTSIYEDMIRRIAPETDSCAPGELHAEKVPDLRSLVIMDAPEIAGAVSFEELRSRGKAIDSARLDEIEAALHPDDAINIQFTSGTTGKPKGATLSHYNIINNARYVTDRIRLTEADRLAIPVPLYHCFGMVMGVLGAVSKGAAMVFPGEAFNPVRTLDALEQEKCTAAYGVPTMFLAMLDELKSNPRDLSCLRTGIMAGSPCPYEVMRRVNTEMNMREVTICYGMTETSPVSFQSFVDDPTEKRCQTVGRIHPHLEVKIIDQEGRAVPVGAQGELCARGYSVMKGYWGDEAQSRACIRDGWMHTGDLANLDEDGYCAIVGRLKDMIIRGGENIFPREIEELIICHPKVSDAQVFGIDDEKYGEIVCAWVIPRSGAPVTEAEIQDYVRERLAHFKVPSHIRVVGAFPLTVTGKPQKFVMRRETSDWLRRRRATASPHTPPDAGGRS